MDDQKPDEDEAKWFAEKVVQPTAEVEAKYGLEAGVLTACDHVNACFEAGMELRPVSAAEAEALDRILASTERSVPVSRRKKKKHGHHKRTTSCACSSCGHRTELEAADLYRATRPRCSRCGGPLNRLKEV